MGKLVSLDLSTTCTGYAIFDIESKSLLEYDILKPKVKGITKMKYPKQQLLKMISLSEQINDLLAEIQPEKIVIEEIAGGAKARLTQKTLDGFHYILAHFLLIKGWPIEDIYYYDVSGDKGWRTPDLDLKLTPQDKINNKEHRALNKTLSKGNTKLPIIGFKHLSCRYANQTFGLDLNVDQNKTDGDKADAICMGHAFLLYRYNKQ